VGTGWRRLCAWGGLALAMLLPSCTGQAHPPTGCHGWHVQTGPAGARASNELFGVSTVSARGAWAVGVTLPLGGPARTLVERWQGRAWHAVPSPDRPPGGSFLNAVVALSVSDAWAVGLSRSPGGPARTLIMHCQPEQRTQGQLPGIGGGDIRPRRVGGRLPRRPGSLPIAGGALGWQSLDCRPAAAARRPGQRAECGRRGRLRRRVGGGRIGQGARPISATGPSTRWTELVFCPRSREPAQCHAEWGRRLGSRGRVGCWRHQERRWGPCLQPSGRGPKLARRPRRPAGRAECRPQRPLGGRPGRCLGGRKLIRRPLVPAAGRARRRRKVVERSNPRRPRLRQPPDGRDRVRRWRAVGGRERITRRRSPACPDPSPLRQLALLTTGGGGRRLLAVHLGLVDEH
jgi:hypothetical protein